MSEIFLKEKNSKVLIILKNSEVEWHLSKIARDTGTTYVYVTKFISHLQKINIVRIEQKGKKRIVKLTDRGILIANLLDEINKKMVE